MIREITVYECACAKCNRIWITKTKTVPERCAKCNVKTWNEDQEVALPSEAPRIEMPPAIGYSDRLATARAALASVSASPVAVPVETEEWRFMKVSPQFHDDGNVYREQYLVSNPKKHRTVQVDIDNIEDIVRVTK